MTDKEKIEKLSRLSRVLLESEGDTLDGILEFFSNPSNLDLFNDEELPKISDLVDVIRIILEVENNPPIPPPNRIEWK